MRKAVVSYGGGVDSMGLLLGLVNRAKAREAELTPEERQANKDNLKRIKDEEIRRAKVISSTCPSCSAKLIRGKKNKKNDYKRDWVCSSCSDIHTI